MCVHACKRHIVVQLFKCVIYVIKIVHMRIPMYIQP